jgi:hypothetical protein
MKRIVIGLLMLGPLCTSQVGIGTISPVQELHIAGGSATIRIESLNAVNSADLNDGIKLAPAFITSDGDISLVGSGNSGINPLNIIIDIPNFIPDDPHGYGAGNETGIVVDNDNLGTTVAEQELTELLFTTPQNALLEIRFGVTTLVRGSSMLIGPPWSEPTPNEACQIKIYFYLDFHDDNTGPELSEIYGLNGGYYQSAYGGIAGYPYVNGQGYSDIPAGTHAIHFFGSVKDQGNTFTSVGFGGAEDYLKIRIFE